ncbi:MAG: CDP-alcohol phosphatidyltransferase family protein, partial [Intrasporangium sp.]|uniref:CDP-alcohol phosphatidyltransferase family protein n=1 Tax=Intrasporangium sp. TaxID=1925024 RepID=UPI003F7E5AD2
LWWACYVGLWGLAVMAVFESPDDETALLTRDGAALDAPPTGMPPVRVSVPGREVLSAGTAAHAVTSPTHYSVGVLRVSASDRGRAADLWHAAAGTAVAADPSVAPFDLALLALVRGGVAVQAIPMGPYAVSRGADRAPGAPGSPWQQRLRGASRGNDGAFSMAVIRPVSRRLTAVGLRHGWTPNAVTVASLLVGLLACGLVALDSRAGWVAAAVLLQVSLVVDCVDGEIARFTRSYSPLGGWLDAVGDRVKEFVMVGVVAWVSARRGEDLWTLAVLLLALLAVRHVEDYCYARRTCAAGLRTTPDLLPLDEPVDLGPADAHTTVPEPPRGRAVVVRKVKQVLHLPIAERYLIVSIGLLVFSPAFLLWALAIAVTVAFLWTEAGRTATAMLRRDRFAAGASDDHIVELLDLGLLAAPLEPAARRLTRLRLGWQLPWLVLAAEAAVALIAVGRSAAGGGWAAYLWLAALCWHRYDVVYRLRETGRAPAAWVARLTLGSVLRIVVLVVAAAAGWPVAGIMAWGALALISLYAAEAALDWIGGPRASRPKRTEVAS